jgi:hypothetical protein
MAKQEQYKEAMKAFAGLPALHWPGRSYIYVNADEAPYANVVIRGVTRCPELYELASLEAHEVYHAQHGHIGYHAKNQSLSDQILGLKQEIETLRYERQVFMWFVKEDRQAAHIFQTFRYNPLDNIKRIDESISQGLTLVKNLEEKLASR